MRRLFRLTKALFCWIIKGCPKAKTAKKRMQICKRCGFYNCGKCTICGCTLEYKTKMKTEECPIKKW
jgi:hypothetical protein